MTQSTFSQAYRSTGGLLADTQMHSHNFWEPTAIMSLLCERE